MLNVIQRPQKEIYNTPNPTPYDDAYISYWNAGWLPIRYNIESDLFPVNSADTLFTINSVASSGGRAKIVLSASASFVARDWVTVDTPLYSGVYQILQVISATEYVINVAYTATSTGTAIKYYNAYRAVVKVYAGIPPYHELASDDPMSLVATIEVVPNVGNIAVVDVSDLIRDKLSADNDLSLTPNNLNAWTSFRIEYAEAYDVSDGVTVTNFTGTFEDDNYETCDIAEEFLNNTFADGLLYWEQETIGATGTQVWQAGSGNVFILPDNTPTSDRASMVLFQDYPIQKGIEYNITADVSSTNVNNARVFIFGIKNGVLSSIFSEIILSGAINFKWISDKNYDSIGFYVNCTSFNSSPEYRLLNFNMVVTAGCEAYLFASNSVRQFQNQYGGNMFPYIQNLDTDTKGKFMTYFNEVPYFSGRIQDISTIIPAELFRSLGNAGFFGYKLIQYDSEGVEISNTEDIVNGQDDGVYRFDVNALPIVSDAAYFDFYLKTPINSDYGLYFSGGTGPTAKYAIGTSPSALEFGLADDVSFSFRLRKDLTDTQGNVLFTNRSSVDLFGRWIIESNYNPLGYQLTLQMQDVSGIVVFTNLDLISLGEIHDVVIVKIGADPNNWLMYVDGVSVSTIGASTIVGYTADTSTQYSIGTYSGLIDPLQIKLFSVRAFSEALSLSQVQALQADKNVEIDSCIFDLKFAEGHGNNIQDYIGEFNATMFQFTTPETTRGSSNLWIYEDTLLPVTSEDAPTEYSPFEDVQISEIKRFVTPDFAGLNDCTAILGNGGEPIYLTWLNDLGGWEYFLFTGKKVYEEEYEATEFGRNVFNDWDNYFSNGESEGEYLRVRTIRTTQVRSQLLSKELVDAISNIKRSIKVQVVNSDGNKTTVKVDKQSLRKYEDAQKLFTIDFAITYPIVYSQGQ